MIPPVARSSKLSRTGNSESTMIPIIVKRPTRLPRTSRVNRRYRRQPLFFVICHWIFRYGITSLVVFTILWLGISFTLVLFLQPQPAIDALANRFPDVLFSVCTDQKVAALTIDDSPSGTTSILLDTLQRHNSHATFFVLGHKINYRRDILNKILSEGHEIGNHMQNQDASYKLDLGEFRKQLLDVQKLISSLENYDSSSPHWFRPGSGIINDEMVSIAKEEGFRLVLGNVHPFDPQLPYKKVITQHVIARTRP
eukprot:822902_1